MESGKSIETELLYFGRGCTPSAHFHAHAFYQIELCLSGQLPCRNKNDNFILNPGEFWLIPPQCRHEFRESRNRYEYLSLKFLCSRSIPEFRGKDTVSQYNMTAIRHIICDEQPVSPFTPEGKEIIEGHLCGMMRHLAYFRNPDRQETPFIMACRTEVCKMGYLVNVSALAEHFHYTRSQFQYRFANEHGGNAHIKHFIEDILLKQAEKHLRYSAMNLTEIAKAMNFPSIYVFSRFYKRKTGMSPLKVRNRMNSGQ